MRIDRPDINSLTIDGRKYSWPWRINKVVPLNDRVIVHFDPDQWAPYARDGARNVICIRPDGTTMWQIEDTGASDVDPFGRRFYDTYYSIWIDEPSGELWADSIAMLLLIDKDNGQIIRWERKDR
jgi:hypothetical protein